MDASASAASYAVLYNTNDSLVNAHHDGWPSTDNVLTDQAAIYPPPPNAPPPATSVLTDHHTLTGSPVDYHHHSHSMISPSTSSGHRRRASSSAQSPYLTQLAHQASSSSPYASSPQQTQISPAGDVMSSTHFQQIEPSTGPDRVLTRRQRAMLLRKSSAPGEFPRVAQDDSSLRSPLYFASPSPRPHTPSSSAPPSAAYDNSAGLSLTMSSLSRSSTLLQSPCFTSTPGSNSPSYPPYDFFPEPRQSRSNSLSNHSAHGARSTSPALSVASVATSVSHHSGPSSAYPNILPTTMSPLASTRPKQRKQRLFNVDRKAICMFHQENPNARQEDIALRYGVERSTISKILKYKTKWLNVPEHENLRIAKHRPSKFPEIEELLVRWLHETREKRIVLTDALIRNKARETAKGLDIPEEKFKASSGWVENFKHRHGIKRGVWQGEGKNIRTARAMGAGTVPGSKEYSEPVLSPLNPAYPDQDDDEDDEDRAGEEDEEMGSFHHGPGLTLDDHDRQEQLQMTESPVAADEQAWGGLGAQDETPPPDYQHHLPSDLVPTHEQDHTTASHLEPDTHTLTYPEATSESFVASVAVHPSTVVDTVDYQHVPSLETLPGPVSLAEAESSMNRLIEYLDGPGISLILPEERETLNHIKCALFAHAQDLPYRRPPKRAR